MYKVSAYDLMHYCTEIYMWGARHVAVVDGDYASIMLWTVQSYMS